MKHGKKYVEAAKLVDRMAFYEPDEAISLVKKAAPAKFDENRMRRKACGAADQGRGSASKRNR